jgi:ACS family tartrate transporter-like MFS transporter
MIKDIGVKDNMTVGWLTMIPYISGGIGLVGWGMVSDRMNERRWNLLGACVVSTIGLVITGATAGTWWSIVGLCISTFGFYGSKGPFWSMPPMFMTGTAAAASIAWINSIGNLGGFFGPWYVGVLKDWTGNYAGGIYGLAFLCLSSAVVCALFLEIPNPAGTARVAQPAPAAE